MLNISFALFPIRILLVFLSLIGSVCIVQGQTDSSAYTYRSLMDVGYKGLSNGDSLRLDLFLPAMASGKKIPLVIVVHGGGWAFGDKEMESIYYMRKLKEELLRNDFAVASISYRLVSDSIHFPSPVEDCSDAVKWLCKHADRYQLDTANYGIWGGSAGAHLAMLVSYANPGEIGGDASLQDVPLRLNYVIDNFGPTKLNDLFRVNLNGFSTFMFKVFVRKLYDIRLKLTYAMTGYDFKTDKDKVLEVNERFSPLNYVDKPVLPTLIVHGTKDRIVAIKQSEQLQQALEKHQVENNFIKVENGDHGLGNIAKEKTDELVQKTITFIKAHKK
ncbi:alpha/beta hydrolase [Sphingobacterium griseoflavum]|uniref:Lipase n=1 Tax=Sphingobacterium griseoflavum TaxID=1474952 RepID=A0ABQ3HSU2_9SPHI|nr:alpha/beta hydrolase [Sphingobacterium griseoflavum]GHE23242.1 lipase [Sphingobacterium griseoflavum]